MTVTFVSHEECNARYDAAMASVHRLLDKIAEITSDRDAWRAEHENLLAIYQAQTAELAALKTVEPT